MQDYISRKLTGYASQLEFSGYVVNEDLPCFLADSDVIVLPSLWENYPYVCLESMSAGKAIAIAWFTFAVLLIAAGFWTFGNLGDCPVGDACIRARWLDPALLVGTVAVWLLGISRILRKKA